MCCRNYFSNNNRANAEMNTLKISRVPLAYSNANQTTRMSTGIARRTRREWLQLPLIAGALILSGCSSEDAPQAIPLGVGTLAGYGRPNTWATDFAATLGDVEACARSGVDICYVELAGPESALGIGESETAVLVEELYPRLIAKCREQGVTLLAGIANDNAGSAKYGQNGRELGRQTALMQSLISTVFACGPQNVIVQPTAETQTDGGRWLESYAVERLAPEGFVFAYNGDGGQPKTKPSWATWRVWHPFTIGEVPEGNLLDCIVVSDTGDIIKSLSNGSLDGPGDPSAAETFARCMDIIGCPAVIFYAFKYAGKTDVATIEAMGKGVRE